MPQEDSRHRKQLSPYGKVIGSKGRLHTFYQAAQYLIVNPLASLLCLVPSDFGMGLKTEDTKVGRTYKVDIFVTKNLVSCTAATRQATYREAAG